MADLKKAKGSSTAPPPPPPVKDSGSIHNGIPSKPRPPAKPFKLSRALSAGSMTLGRLGKKGTKKNSLQENGVITNEANLQDSGEQDKNENDSNAPRKLPGLGNKPILRKISFKKSQPQSIPESSPIATERELPSVPDTNEDPSQRELPPVPNSNGTAFPSAELNMRELPPVPDTMERKLPTLPNGHSEESPSNLVRPIVNTEKPNSCEPGTKIIKTNSFSKPKEEISSGSQLNSMNQNGLEGSNPAENGMELLEYNGHASCSDSWLEEKAVQDPMAAKSREGDGTSSHANEHEESKSNDDEDVVSECSLSSMENSPNETRKSTNSLAKHDTSVSSAEPVASEELAGDIEETTVEYKDYYTIGEIVSSYSYAIPVSMKILQGYCSDTSDVNISTDDIYLLHSVRHSQMVTVRDEDSMTHKIPIDLPVKMGPIYNPKGDYEESLNGYEFKSVSEILSMPSVPKLMYAKHEISTGEDKNNFSEGEILIVGNTNKSMFKAKRGLKVFSLLTRSKKVILDSSEGLFSTKPSLVRVEFSTFVEFLSQTFPTQVVVYPSTVDSTATAEFPGTRSRVATIQGCKTETALVVSDVSTLTNEEATQASLLPIPTESPISFDLLLDDDIAALEVIVQRWTYPEEEDEEFIAEDETAVGPEHYYDDTADLFGREKDREEVISRSSASSDKRVSVVSTDDPTYVNIPKDLNSSTQSSSMATAEDKSVKDKQFLEEDEDAGYDTVGLHLIRESSPIETRTDSSNPTNTMPSFEPGYSTVGSTVPLCRPPTVSGYSKIGPKSTAVPKKTKRATGYSEVLPKKSVNGVVVEDTCSSSQDKKFILKDSIGGGADILKTEAKSTPESSDMSRMQVMLEMLTKKMESVDTQLVTLATTPGAASGGADDQIQPASREPDKTEAKIEKVSSESENLDFLRSLEVDEIGKLVSAMGLEQYKEKFLVEQISGEIFMECDESVLKDEIGITSKIHRIRLMKVISGQHSAKGILEKKKTT